MLTDLKAQKSAAAKPELGKTARNASDCAFKATRLRRAIGKVRVLISMGWVSVGGWTGA